MLKPLACLAAALALQAPAAAPPDTEIYLAPLSTSGASLVVGQPADITRSPGYDNQPSFTPDGAAILFTSVRGGGTLPDIYRFDLSSKETTRVTGTPEGEYSPTVTPDRRHISVIRVERDSTQRLWQFTIDGKDPSLVLTDVKPVGYHAWADAHTLALFVLGKPATLQLADTRTGRAQTLASDIGRSLTRVPGRATIAFVQRDPKSAPGGIAALWIRELDPRTKTITPLTRAVAGAGEADLAWTPDGRLLMADADVLYQWRRGDPDWTRVADLAALGLHGVTRLAVSPKGDAIAIVASPPR